MNYGIVRTPCMAVRKEANERSEMSSQLLFGEIFEILEDRPPWLFVKNEYDAYEGWISRSGVGFLSSEDLESYRGYSNCIQPLPFLYMQGEGMKVRIPVPAGAVLYYKDSNPLLVHCGSYYMMQEPCQNMEGDLDDQIIATGKQFLNLPYLWGGKSSYGTDCSGLVQTVFKIIGIPAARDTSDQVKQGSTVNLFSEARTGDLAFFDNEEGEIVHVGLMMETGKILHASGYVRIDPVDHQGIYNSEQEKYTHKLRVIKRIT
ncbi:NlpC/P60 family protein [Bacteroidota bacterium]